MSIKYDANQLRMLASKMKSLYDDNGNNLLKKTTNVSNSGTGNDFSKIRFANLEMMGFTLSSHGVLLQNKLEKQVNFLYEAANKVNEGSTAVEKIIRAAWRENPLDIREEKASWMESTPAQLVSAISTWNDAFEGAKDAYSVSYAMNMGIKYSIIAKTLTAAGESAASKLLGRTFAVVGAIANYQEWSSALEKQKIIDEDYNYSHDGIDAAGDMTTNYIMPVIGSIGVAAGVVALVSTAPIVVTTAVIVGGVCALVSIADGYLGGALSEAAGEGVRVVGDFFNDAGKGISEGAENVAKGISEGAENIAKGVGDFFQGFKFGW